MRSQFQGIEFKLLCKLLNLQHASRIMVTNFNNFDMIEIKIFFRQFLYHLNMWILNNFMTSIFVNAPLKKIEITMVMYYLQCYFKFQQSEEIVIQTSICPSYNYIHLLDDISRKRGNCKLI